MPPSSVRAQLVGSWELLSYSLYLAHDPTDKIYPMGSDVQGIIMYTSDGYMSAQLWTPGQRQPFAEETPFDRPPLAAALADAASVQNWARIGRSYVAYTGEFYLDEQGDEQGRPILMHRMRGASLPGMVGDVQRRILSFRDGHDDGGGKRDIMVLGLDQTIDVRGEARRVDVQWRRLPVNEAPGPERGDRLGERWAL